MDSAPVVPVSSPLIPPEGHKADEPRPSSPSPTSPSPSLSSSFRNSHTLEERVKLFEKVRASFPDRVPLIVERSPKCAADFPVLSRSKFLVPVDVTFQKFIADVKNHIELPPAASLFLIISGVNIVPGPNYLVKHLYDKYKSDDGFLYIEYSGMDVMGMA